MFLNSANADFMTFRRLFLHIGHMIFYDFFYIQNKWGKYMTYEAFFFKKSHMLIFLSDKKYDLF